MNTTDKTKHKHIANLLENGRLSAIWKCSMCKQYVLFSSHDGADDDYPNHCDSCWFEAKKIERIIQLIDNEKPDPKFIDQLIIKLLENRHATNN